MTTHKEAAAKYPICEVFLAQLDAAGRVTFANMGTQFQKAKDRCAELGLVRIGASDVLTPRDVEQTFHGMILPGTPGSDAPQGITRWLGSVTLYYRPRMATTTVSP